MTWMDVVRYTPRRELLGDIASLTVSRMIRKDNSEQRKLTDSVVGPARTYERDPRPLAQQFQEMTSNEA